MLFLFWRCAQVVPLSGGQRDLDPPKLLESNPANATLNFKGKIIEFRFDEFVQVRDIANQLVVTPQTKEKPVVEANGKKVTVKFNEDLMPNTTYRLFFGNAISDMRESNAISNFEYVFSTGNSIDSLFIEGRITKAFNLKPEKETTVGLYIADEADSVVFKKKPLYFTKTNDNGTYKLSYLPKASFKIFAFTDYNKNLLFDGGEEAVGFNDKIIKTEIDSTIMLKTFKEPSAKVFVKKASSPFYGLAYIIYNKELKNVVESYYKDQQINISGGSGINDTCKVFYKNIFDTLRLKVHHPDINKTDTVSIIIASKERFERLKSENKNILTIDLGPLTGTKLDYFADPFLVFNNWIDEANIDVSKTTLICKTDSITKTGIQLRKKRENVLDITNKLMPATNYELILKKGAFRSMIGTESDSVKITFKTTESSDYAKLNLKLLLPRKENYIVQLVDATEMVIAEQYIEMSLTSSAEQMLKFKNLIPGNYFVKVIEDKNQNKKWDTGDLSLQKQPETIYFNALTIKLLADWDSETEWKVD